MFIFPFNVEILVEAIYLGGLVRKLKFRLKTWVAYFLSRSCHSLCFCHSKEVCLLFAWLFPAYKELTGTSPAEFHFIKEIKIKLY